VINLKRKIRTILAILVLVTTISGCSDRVVYNKYSNTFFDSFDTVTQIIGYTQTEEEFSLYAVDIHDRFLELHKLFDKYNNYDGINNIKTINDNAGIKPVKVKPEIMDLIVFSKQMYKDTNQKTNIAFGSVLSIWSDYREMAEADPADAKLPPMEQLLEANKHTDIDKVIVNENDSTIFLEDPDIKIDVGAVAKGFATEIVVKEMIEKGLDSWIISAGGNIRSVNKPMEETKDRWAIGIQNPDKEIFGDGGNILDTVFLNNAAVVSSGDYQRYYYVGDKRIHHIISPDTLMPADYYRAVNVITDDAGYGDYYSTEIFLLPYEQSRALVESKENLEAVWIFADGTMEMTEGFKKVSKSQGAIIND
jgi:thiamine biosynthesis lipoprotein